MLNAIDSQFSLNDAGEILYQTDASNPTPGVLIARVKKGDAPLKPGVELAESEVTASLDSAAVQERLQKWLSAHIGTLLEPLVALEDGSELPAPVKGIAFQVFEAMGIVERAELEDLIAELDQDMRGVLRSKRIRLGPVLVFMPDLNKPAAVRLRALLWTLWQGKDLPAAVPHDGIVSFKIEPTEIDPRFYQAIGYPVYGPRAIRIDMLDRVISAVYDGAEDGKFQAQHKMAEWLGCSIEDLYAVLTAMGHSKIHDPAEEAEKKEGEDELAKVATPPAPEEIKDVPEADEKKPEEKDVQKQEEVKPELATFRLKKGKAFQSSKPRDKKPFKKKEDKPQKKKGKRNKSTNRTPKVMSAGPKPKLEDSPFAILEQLKKKDGS